MRAAGVAIASRSASAIAATEPGSTSHPFTPCSTSSDTPATEVAITGRAWANASSAGAGKPSDRLGSTTARAPAIRSRRSSPRGSPTNLTRLLNPRRRASASSSLRSGPSPTITISNASRSAASRAAASTRIRWPLVSHSRPTHTNRARCGLAAKGRGSEAASASGSAAPFEAHDGPNDVDLVPLLVPAAPQELRAAVRVVGHDERRVADLLRQPGGAGVVELGRPVGDEAVRRPAERAAQQGDGRRVRAAVRVDVLDAGRPASRRAACTPRRGASGCPTCAARPAARGASPAAGPRRRTSASTRAWRTWCRGTRGRCACG